MSLNLVDLMKLCGFDPVGKRLKIARHLDKRISVSALYETGEFYQRHQNTNVFDCEYIVSCLGMPGLLAKMIGVYEVKRTQENYSCPSNSPTELWRLAPRGPHCFYDLKKLDGDLEGLYGRVVVKWSWPKDPINWCKKLEGSKTGYADSTRLESIVKEDASRAQDFVFSILHTLPLIARPDEVLKWERIWKNKLQAQDIDIGYNLN